MCAHKFQDGEITLTMSASEFYTAFADFGSITPGAKSSICMAGEDVYRQWNYTSFGCGEGVFDRLR
jgi:hypothetical protein